MRRFEQNGCLALVLHAHLPFVRHPEHERFLEETWFFEAVTEVYLPLLRVFEGWQKDGLQARISLTLSPTVCAMLSDPLLSRRYLAHLDSLIELSERETLRTLWEPGTGALAEFYLLRLRKAHASYVERNGDLLASFRRLQDGGIIEIITCSATHAVLPLLEHGPSVRAQLQVAVDDYRSRFGRAPRGIWLPECAYDCSLDPFLADAQLQWFITDTHGLLHASPRPVRGTFAPVRTPSGLGAFGRDHDSARQVWSRHEGYPGDPRYRDFYRDIGYDLDWDYLKPYLPTEGDRASTGIKYYAVTGGTGPKKLYEPEIARKVAMEHARHFVSKRAEQVRRASELLGIPPIVVCPYDAELFGHWWYEGPDFLDWVGREACRPGSGVRMMTPGDYLEGSPILQVSTPGTSSWGEGGYFKMWLNEANEWIHRRLLPTQKLMSSLSSEFANSGELQSRALKQAGRELLLAQASDWPFILKTGTSPSYARSRVEDHLANFTSLANQLQSGAISEDLLVRQELKNNIFPMLDPRYWCVSR